MADLDSPIGDVAAAILDGVPIDWAALESSTDAAGRSTISQLKVLARIADLHGCPASATLGFSQSTLLPLDSGSLVQWGHLRVLEPLGRGAFGEVYRAWDTRLDREVALKLLPAHSDEGDRASSIIQEGRLLARVHHSNVATIYGAERIDDTVGLWMELVHGRTLEQTLAGGRRFTVEEVIDIGVQLSHALAAVHGAGLLHRDVKAQNVMLTGEGRAVLMDFGTGRELSDRSGGAAGTPLYLAPELLADEPAATVQTDVYALGVLLYHLLTGGYPVAARTLDDLRLAHRQQRTIGLRSLRPDVPSGFADVVGRAIEPAADVRYSSAAALSAALESCRRRQRHVPAAYAFAMAALVVFSVWIASGEPGRMFAGPGKLSGGVVTGSHWPPTPVERPVIAVLPFRNLSREDGSESFVDGLTDEIIRSLAVIDGLQVRSRTSSFAFKNKSNSLREVADRLAVNLIMDGSVLTSGQQLRVHVSLIKVAGEVPLWAERFDRELKDVLAIQDEISRAIANRLRLTLGRAQRADTTLAAYEPYLKALGLNDRRGPDNARLAVRLFEQAIDADPNYAPAYAGLAHAYAFMSITYMGISGDAALALMRPAAAKALELDPQLAEAHAAMGVVQAREHDWAASERSFRRAIELNPTLTQSYSNYSFFTLRPMGRFDEAEALVTNALQVYPQSLDLERELAELEFTAGRYEDAIDRLQRLRAIDPDFPFADMYLARALTYAGRVDEAFAFLDAMDRLGQSPPHYRANALLRAGRRQEAEALALQNRAFPYRAAIIYGVLGDLDGAFEALERAAVEEPQRLPLLLTWPEMASVRRDPRLASFRQRHGLPAF